VRLPNVTEGARELCDRTGIAGLVLTGGNDLAALGGDAPERDTTENALLDFAERRKLPVLGVDIPLRRVGGHVTESSRFAAGCVGSLGRRRCQSDPPFGPTYNGNYVAP
jgi:hypothetical protein